MTPTRANSNNQLVIISLVCNYGFWKELRPAVPFLTPYLVSPLKNFTEVELYSEVYPYWTYSYAVFLVPVFILTDLLRHRPVILCEALGYTATWLLLIYGRSTFDMQLMQVVFGFATAAEVAYFAYIYSAVSADRYAAVTSYVRTGALLGKCAAYTLGQMLLWTEWGDYLLLNYLSLATVSVCTAIALILLCYRPTVQPPDEQELDLRTREGNELVSEEVPIRQPVEPPSSNLVAEFVDYLKTTASAFRQCASSAFVVQWCLWWSFSTCGFLQVGNYIQTLWAPLQRSAGVDSVQNGVVEAVSTLLCSMMVFVVQYARSDWRNVGELYLGSMTLLQTICLAVMSVSGQIWVTYSLYIIYCVCYQTLITIATYNIAKSVASANHGLVFGWNTLMALVLQTVLTFAVADQHGFALDIRTQFLVYGAYHLTISVVFLGMSVVTMRKIGIKRCFWSSLPNE